MSQWIRALVGETKAELRKAAKDALGDIQEGSQEVALMEWYWLAVLLTVASGSWYLMLLGAGRQTGLW
jgi:hypothetical protein